MAIMAAIVHNYFIDLLRQLIGAAPSGRLSRFALSGRFTVWT
jgi:hypothetical protein